MSGRPVDPGRSRIVLVGTPAYRDPQLPDVPVVAKNIADLAAVLTDPQIGGFDAAHCVTSPDGAGIAEVGDLLLQAASEAEDLLLFYYSGHGLLGTRNHELYLSLYGTRPDRVAFTALRFAAVRDACLESGAASRVVILDSCFSGRAIGETLGDPDEEIMGHVEVAGTYTMTSAPANRTALILPGEQHTAFTERLLRLLRDGSPRAGEMLSLGDIYRHLHARLRAEGLPVPQQRGTETADLLGLVRNRFLPRPADELSHGLGITVENWKTSAKKNVILIPAYTELPADNKITYRIVDGNQTSIELPVNEGDDEDLNFVEQVGIARLFLKRSFPRGYPITIDFKVSADSLVSIEAHDGQTGEFLGNALLSLDDEEQLGFVPRSAGRLRSRRSGRIFGIGLGTTNSAIAYTDPAGTTEVIAGQDGGRKVPSVVYFPQDGDPVVGAIARDYAIIVPQRVARLFMWGMGARTYLPDDKPFVVDGKTWSPEELSALMLHKLAQMAQQRYGESARQAVIAVPAHFGQAERAAIRSAGETADLKVLRMITRPAAVAAVHGLGRPGDPGRILVFGLGGTTYDVTVIGVDADGAMKVLATGRDRQLGGGDFDELVLGKMYSAARQGGLDIETEPWARQQAYAQAEDIKKELSLADIAGRSLTGSGRPVRFDLSRSEFESLLTDKLLQVEDTILDTIETAGLRPSDLSEVLMVGGSSRIPAFQKLLARVSGREPVFSSNLEEEVVRGAANFAARAI